MSDLGIRVSLRGPIFEHAPDYAVDEGGGEAFAEIGILGQRFVQAQLYKGHGVRTSHFRRSVHGGVVRHLTAQIDAGLYQQGANVVYTNWLEGTSRRNRPRPGFPGYWMFANALRRLRGMDLAALIEERILRRLR